MRRWVLPALALAGAGLANGRPSSLLPSDASSKPKEFGEPGDECFLACDKTAGPCPGFCRATGKGETWSGSCCIQGGWNNGVQAIGEGEGCGNRGCELNHCCVKDDPPPPNPRILGGWTDCGESSGITSAAIMGQTKRFRLKVKGWGQPKAPPPNCTREEEDALMFKDVQAERGREPSYSHEWGATAILPGKFGGDALAPIHGVASDYRYFWLTFGGEDTDSTSWMDTAENDIVRAGAHGAAFDIEGGVTPKDMHEWILQMRAKHPTWTYVYIPQAADKMVGYTDDGPDYVAPMLYYSNHNSYPALDISKSNEKSESLNALLKLRKAGWPASRTILTYQSFDACRSRVHGDNGLLPLLGKLMGEHSVMMHVYGEAYALKGPYAGVLGWPAQCGEDDQRCWPDADRANLEEVMEGARQSGGSGKGAAHFKVTGPVLASGADGEESTEPCPGHPNILLSSLSCQSKLDKAVLNKEKADSLEQGLCPGHPNILLTSPACTESRASEGAGTDAAGEEVMAREAETWRRARQVRPPP